MSNASWFALQVRPTRENKVFSSLVMKGYECMLPSCRLRRKGASGVRTPLFPGYMFCRLDTQESKVPLLFTPDVFGLVGFGGSPVPVADSEINAISRITESGMSVEPLPYLKPGMQVRLLAGPLMGLQGVVIEHRSYTHLVVTVELLQRSIAVEIMADWVSPAPTHAHNIITTKGVTTSL